MTSKIKMILYFIVLYIGGVLLMEQKDIVKNPK